LPFSLSISCTDLSNRLWSLWSYSGRRNVRSLSLLTKSIDVTVGSPKNIGMCVIRWKFKRVLQCQTLKPGAKSQSLRLLNKAITRVCIVRTRILKSSSLFVQLLQSVARAYLTCWLIWFPSVRLVLQSNSMNATNLSARL
jgi:hypothetical protein